MTDPNETANLVGQLTQGYREHKAEEAGPGSPPYPAGSSAATSRARPTRWPMTLPAWPSLLAAFAQEPQRSMDVIAVFRGLSRAAESMAAAAAELRRQEWFDLEDDAEPEAIAAWNGVLEGLKSAASTFEWVADGWI